MPTHFAIPRRTILATIVGIIIVLLVIFAIIRLPQATITIYPATYDRSVSQEITLSGSNRKPDFVRFILPAKFAEAEITESKTVARSAGQTFDDFAKGNVTMINKQSEEQRLLPKTHLRHEATGVFFLTDTAVTIPPESEIKVAVTAKEKGAVGNVAAGKLLVDKLPASVQQAVYAESAAPFSGGVAVDSPLAEAEINQAKAETLQKAREKARAELSTKAGGIAINDQLIAIDVRDENISAAPGSKSTEFTVTTKVAARGFFPDNNDVLSLTLLALRSSPKADEEFISYAPESFQMEIIRSDFERGEARIKGTLTGKFAQKTGPNIFNADNLAGRSQSEVQEYFKQFPSISRAEVALSPFWVRSVPARPEATKVIIQNAQ